MKRLGFLLGLLTFLLVICCFHKQVREGFELTMELTLQKMVSQKSLQVDQHTLPYQAICVKLATGGEQCKPPYVCQTPSNQQYGNCL